MTIKGTTVDDALIVDAFGRWDRSQHAVIAILLTNGKYVRFESRNPAEADAMQKQLNEAVDVARRNNYFAI